MQNAATHLPLSSTEQQIVPAFKVVIAFEDARTCRQAYEACDFVAQNLTHEWRVIRQLWKFELLGIPELREMAAEEALMADVVVVACHGDRELPADVRAWVDKWAGEKEGTIALVAILDGAPARAEGPRSALAYLETAAKRGGMEFLIWPQLCLNQRSLGVTRRSKVPSEALLEAA